MAPTTNHHEFGASHQEIEGSSDRSFGLVFAAAFGVLAVSLAWRGNGWWPASLVASAAVLILALARPALLAPFNRLWTLFGLLLGRIVAPIAMGLIYFGVITPMGFTIRLIGKDLLRLRRCLAAPTYWLPRRDQDPEPKRLRDQF